MSSLSFSLVSFILEATHKWLTALRIHSWLSRKLGCGIWGSHPSEIIGKFVFSLEDPPMAAPGIFPIGSLGGSSEESSHLLLRDRENYKPGCQLLESRVWGGSGEHTIPWADFPLTPLSSACFPSLLTPLHGDLPSFLSSISEENKPPVSCKVPNFTRIGKGV